MLSSTSFFMREFQEGLRRYLIEDLDKHGVLIINDVVYLGYECYGIHKGTKIPKLAKLLQRKSTTMLEYSKLNTVRGDMNNLHKFILYTEKVTTLEVFNVNFFAKAQMEKTAPKRQCLDGT